MTCVSTPNAPDVFKQRLLPCATNIEARLSECLTADARQPQPPQRLIAAMRYGALGGGKRLRPFLLVESAALFGADADGALNAGAALECVHCYSLIHDDLPAMDDDDLRRGRPTVHKAFDEATAILAGDSLLTLAFEIMASERTHPDAKVRAELVLGLARASGWCGMAGGQQRDLDAETAAAPLNAAEIELMQAMKTGALITFACEAGAILGGAGEAERSALKRYGQLAGRAFQLADDILDLEGDATTVGKATAKDKDAGKATLVSLMGVEAARQLLHGLVEEAKAALEPFGAKAVMLRDAAEFVANRKS